MRLVVIISGLFMCFSAGAQKPFVRDYPLLESGAAVKVNAMARDRIGYMWLGTDIGLMRFNGRTFVRIPDSIGKPVTAVAVSGNRVRAGYANGAIGEVVDQAVRRIKVRGGPSSSITSLYLGAANTIIAGTEEQGLFMIMDRVAIPVNLSNGLSDNFIYGFSILNSLHLVAGTDDGINEVSITQSGFAVSHLTTRNGLPDNIVSAVQPIPGSRQCWIGTQEGGVAIYDSGSGKIYGRPRPRTEWIYGQVNDILPVSDRRAWAATESGYLLELTLAGTDSFAIRAYYYPGKVFRKLIADKVGNVWCATNKGVTLMTGEYLLGLKIAGDYRLNEVTAMLSDDGALLIALKKQVYRISLHDSSVHLAPFFKAGTPVTSLYRDNRGRIWIGTLGDGLYYQQHLSSFSKVRELPEISPDACILSIAGAKGQIWVAGLKGVEELACDERGHISLVKHHGKKSGIGSDYVYQLYPDRQENVWMATDGAGVCMYDGVQYHHWNGEFDQKSKVAYTVTEDTFGDIWAGTMYKDLFRLHQDKWMNLRLPETQYPDVNISAVSANSTGQVVSVYQRCIDQWYPGSHFFRHYNSALGIGIDSTSAVLNCVARDNSGNIYVPYEHGVLMFRNQPVTYDIRPAVKILPPEIYSKRTHKYKRHFEHDENYLGFTFDGISYANPERLNYRYMLQGYNDEWIPTNDATVSFPKLMPGKYHFRVQVSLNPAFEYPREDDYDFSIAAPYWKTNWFYFLCILFVVLCGYLFVKIREKRLKHIAGLRQDRMMFEYEHLKSQVNPHFLFNSLYALSILIEEKKDNALEYTVNLADLYRNMLSYSRNDVILLKEEMDILNSYIHIQHTRFGDSLQVNTDIPEQMLESKKIIPLALQLLVENAIKHNVVSQAQPLVIEIHADEDEITVSNAIQLKISKDRGAGIGLVNIKQRYGQLTRKPVTYGVVNNEFVVKLPLL